jgi:hypothetical protein
MYTKLSKICNQTPSINALVSETVPRNVKYQEAFAEREKQKSVYLASDKDIKMFSALQEGPKQTLIKKKKKGAAESMDIDEPSPLTRAAQKAARKELDDRLYEVAFWLADLKANVAGDARLGIRTEVTNLVRSFINNPDSIRGSYLNFAFLGAPGTGKSQLARSLGSVISSLCLLSTTDFYSLTAADLIGEYLGQTAIKTQKVLLRGLGGVTFVDEAYALAMKGSDYGAEAIAQIVATLDKRKAEMVLMVAGYVREMERDFFGVNPGMARRIPYQWVLNSYTSKDLMTIFRSYFTREENPKGIEYYLSGRAVAYIERFLNLFHPYFTNQAGDVENIFSDVKKVRSNRDAPLENEDLDQALGVITKRITPKVEEKKEFDVPRCVNNLSQILDDLKVRDVDQSALMGCPEVDVNMVRVSPAQSEAYESSLFNNSNKKRKRKGGNNDRDDVDIVQNSDDE